MKTSNFLIIVLLSVSAIYFTLYSRLGSDHKLITIEFPQKGDQTLKDKNTAHFEENHSIFNSNTKTVTSLISEDYLDDYVDTENKRSHTNSQGNNRKTFKKFNNRKIDL